MTTHWQRSSRCSDSACLEWTRTGDTVSIRNSLNPEVVVTFTVEQWSVFIAAVEEGEMG